LALGERYEPSIIDGPEFPKLTGARHGTFREENCNSRYQRFRAIRVGGSRDTLKQAGATVEIISLQADEIKGWDKKDWGRPVKVDKTLDDASASDYDAIVLPGGQINPDLLRVGPRRSNLSRTSLKPRKSLPPFATRPGC
jgi:hypothetical protein